MVRLGLELRERGHEVGLACPAAPPEAGRSLGAEAAAMGLPPALPVSRGRGARPLADRDDVRKLRAYLVEKRVEVVHTWHTRDHVLALRAAGALSRDVALVRSYRKAETIPASPWNRWLFGPGTDGLLCASPETARRNARLRGGRPVRGAFGAVDVERFRPAPSDPAVRRSLGLAPEHRVVGIVARVQPHRRFDLLLEAAALMCRSDPVARVLVVGRGTRRASLAEGPAQRLGLGDRVLFAGYRHGDYGEVLRTIDVFTFLVPGSDGTCRALLEAAACGIPAVTSRRGSLPEIVVHGETGLLVDESPEALAVAWRELLDDGQRRRALGEAARKRAEDLFTPARMASTVEALYREARG
jgi:glycosyltransferase involved in cell wall biosynthesis